MFCNVCGADIGDAIGLCDTCRQKRTAARQRGLEEAKEKAHKTYRDGQLRRASSGVGVSLLADPKRLAALTSGLFLLLFALFIVLHPRNDIWEAFLLSVLAVVFLVAAGFWAIMWMELFIDNFIIALSAMIIPISVYYLVVAHPERAMKPFKIHGIALGIFLALGFGFEHLTGSSAGDLFSEMFGDKEAEESYYDEYDRYDSGYGGALDAADLFVPR